MKDPRPTIPKATKEIVLKEFSHSCGTCGNKEVIPEIHHIDEDRTNNDTLNLIPLCSNCHTKQHNAFKRIDKDILKFYRKYKHPYILLPQFHPIFKRTIFLNKNDEYTIEELDLKVKELVALINVHEMGVFYSNQIELLINLPVIKTIWFGGESIDSVNREEVYKDFRERLIKNKEKLYELILEMLWYQKWN